MLSFQTIAARLLHASPLFSRHPHPPALYVPGEVTRVKYKFRKPLAMYVSNDNPGAAHVAEELRQLIGAQLTLYRGTRIE